MIRGKVLCRTRRETKGSDGKALFIITLSILATQGVFVVQRWADVPIPKELPFVGEQVELPIRISAYPSRNRMGSSSSPWRQTCRSSRT